MAELTDQDLRDIIEMIHGQNMARNVAVRALLRERPSTKEVLADFLADVEAGDGLPEARPASRANRSSPRCVGW